jgi:hypothetical protein
MMLVFIAVFKYNDTLKKKKFFATGPNFRFGLLRIFLEV